MSLSISPDQKDWTPEQRKMLGAVVHGGRLDEATSLQLLHFCQRTGLDIFTKQAYAIARGGKIQLQAGVDGLAAVAQRAAAARGLVIGNRPTKYYTADGSSMPFAPSNLHALTYTLTITDVKSGAVAEYNSTVLMSEYGQSNNMWRKMPAVMLEKVALSKAYRMAFPTDLSGIYSTEEVDLRDSNNDHGFAGRRQPPAAPESMVDAREVHDPFAADTQPPEGSVSVGDAKRALMAKFSDGTGLDRDAAIAMCKSLWSDSGAPSEGNVEQDLLDAMLASADALLGLAEGATIVEGGE
jgi:phage recombination protein Bet